ncbi:hypothetical protein Tco_0986447 [Tanacetum coccineum]
MNLSQLLLEATKVLQLLKLTQLLLCKRTNHRTCDHAEFMSSININQYHTSQGEFSSRSRPARPAIPFPSCLHCRYNDHKSDDYVYFPICEICGSYDHDTHGHNRIISLRRGIKPRNPQHVTKNCETCGTNVHTTSDHNDIEWFRKREALQAKKVESFKASKTESSSALRSKTPTKKYLLGTPSLGLQANKQQSVAMFSTKAEDIAAAGCYAIILWIKSQLTDYDIIYEKLPITIQFCTKKTKLIDVTSRIILSNTQYQLADIFIKPLDELSFKRLIVELGLDEIIAGCLCMIRGRVWKQLRLWVKVLTALWLLMVMKSLVFSDYEIGVKEWAGIDIDMAVSDMG